MNMIDKVAQALADSLDDSLSWMDYREQARTAIETMREPTKEMSAAGCENNYQCYATAAWQAMIDKALEGGDAQ